MDKVSREEKKSMQKTMSYFGRERASRYFLDVSKTEGALSSDTFFHEYLERLYPAFEASRTISKKQISSEIISAILHLVFSDAPSTLLAGLYAYEAFERCESCAVMPFSVVSPELTAYIQEILHAGFASSRLSDAPPTLLRRIRRWYREHEERLSDAS